MYKVIKLRSCHFTAAPFAPAVAASVLLLSFLSIAPGQDASAPQLQLITAHSPAIIDAKAAVPAEGPNPSIEINAGDNISGNPRRFQYGLRLTIRGVYDDNINISHTNRIQDYYFAIEPGATIGFGDIWGRTGNYVRLDYAPSIFLFLDHDEENAVQHLIRLEGFHQFARLSLTFSQDAAILKDSYVTLLSSDGTTGQTTNIDVGGRNRVDIFGTRLGWTYDLTGKTFLSGEFLNTVYDYENNLISSDQFSGSLFINYNYSPKLALGIGGAGGYNWVDSPTPDQTFEQALVRATYQATGKISLNASAGVEFRQFGGNGAGDHVSPVYELGATYQPFDGTTILVRGSRRTLNSGIFAGQDFAASNIIVGIRQRLLRRIYVGFTGGYENADYFSTIRGVSATRNDDYYYVEPAVDVMIMRFWTVGAYYLHREDFSNFTNFSFYDNQVGVRNTLKF